MATRRARRFWQWVVLSAGIVLASVFVVLAVMQSQPVASVSSAQSEPAQEQVIHEVPPSVASSAAPSHQAVPRTQINPETLTIASIGFHKTPLEQMSAGEQGSTLNPPTYDDPAMVWRNFAPTWIRNLGAPGQPRANKTHIIGHACSADCIDTSWRRFNHLADLKVGEVITLGTSGGELHYKVTGTLFYQQGTPVSDELKRRLWLQEPDKPDELQLMSCSESVPGSGNYDQRTIVFAQLVT